MPTLHKDYSTMPPQCLHYRVHAIIDCLTEGLNGPVVSGSELGKTALGAIREGPRRATFYNLHSVAIHDPAPLIATYAQHQTVDGVVLHFDSVNGALVQNPTALDGCTQQLHRLLALLLLLAEGGEV